MTRNAKPEPERRTAVWRRLLLPSDRLPAVWHVTGAYLAQRGLGALLVDLDNTLVGWNRDDPPPELAGWLDGLRSAGVPLRVLSNNGRTRVARFCDRLGLEAVPSAGKPGTRGLRAAMEQLGRRAGETALVGDRLLTDVVAGNRAGLYTVLVPPVDPREFVFTRWLRAWEDRYVARQAGRQMSKTSRS